MFISMSGVERSQPSHWIQLSGWWTEVDSHGGMKAVLHHYGSFWVFLLCLRRGPILSPIPLQPVVPTGPSPSHFSLFIEMGWYLWVFYYFFFFFFFFGDRDYFSIKSSIFQGRILGYTLRLFSQLARVHQIAAVDLCVNHVIKS